MVLAATAGPTGERTSREETHNYLVAGGKAAGAGLARPTDPTLTVQAHLVKRVPAVHFTRAAWRRHEQSVDASRAPHLTKRRSVSEENAMARIKVGVQLCQQHTSYKAYENAWRHADALGVDSIWNWDHFFPVWGDENGAHFECWTTLSALGPQTKHAHIGSLVLCTAYRNASLVSQMAKTLDHITGGRFILGLGAGWFETDFKEYGYKFGTASERLHDLEQAILMIKERWTKDRPQPINGVVPILVGGGGEKVTLHIAAKHANFWCGFGPSELWERKNTVLNEWCVKVNRNPEQIERVALINRKDLDKLDEFIDAGATHLICEVSVPFDMDPIEDALKWRNKLNL